MTETETRLILSKQDLLQRLLEQVLEKLGRTESLLDRLASNQPASTEALKYAGYKEPRDAMKALFAETERPMAEEEIKVEIVDKGGFRRGVPATIKNSRMAVQKSIKLHLSGDGAKKWPLKMHNGLIGPKEWVNDRFEQSGLLARVGPPLHLPGVEDSLFSSLI
jgi:hypothetical protein